MECVAQGQTASRWWSQLLLVQILVTALSSRLCRVHLDSVFNKALFLVQFTSATVF